MRTVANPKWKVATLLVAILLLPSTEGLAEDFPPTICQEVDSTKTGGGTVTDTDGNPISKAQVFATGHRAYEPNNLYQANFFDDVVNTDSEGKYALSTNYRWATHHVVAAAGYAPQVVAIPEDGETTTVTLELGRTVTGNVLAPDGTPLKNATVQMTHWFKQRTKKLESEYERFGSNSNLAAPIYLFGKNSAVRTNDEGHFEIKDAPLHRVALVVKAKGLLEEVFYVRGSENGREESRGVDFKDQALVGNGATLVTRRCNTLTLSGIDEFGEPAAISRVFLQPITKAMNPEVLRRPVEIDRERRINLPAYTNGFVAFVEPEDNARLLGRRIEFDPVSKEEPQDVTRKVTFQSGVPLRGMVVDQKTGTGIAGVPLRWRSMDFKETDSANNLAPLETRTDEAGTFEIAVPDSDGKFGVVGNIPGYRTVFYWNKVPNMNGEPPLELDCISRYVEKLETGNIASLPPFRFELLPSFRINVSVEMKDGTPVPECKVIGRTYASRPFARGYSREEKTTTTDDLGKCQFDHFYSNDIELEAALNRGEDPETNPQFYLKEYPTTLRAFSKSGYVGSAAIPLPDLDEASDEINMTFTLSDPGNVQGQILNFDGEPAAGLKVTASTAGFSGKDTGHVWTTETRDDGRFLMADFPVSIEARWTLDGTRAKTGNNNIELDLSNLRSNSTLEIPPIEILDLKHLTEPFPEVSIKSPDNAAALETLHDFAVEQVAKLPESSKELRRFLSSRNSGDALGQYGTRLENKLVPLIEELADRDVGGEFELRVLSLASSWFIRPYKPGTIPYLGLSEGKRITSCCHKRLMENQIEQEDAQDLIVRLTKGVAQQAFHNRTSAWDVLKEKSPFVKTKAIADCHIAISKVWNVQQICQSDVSAKDFQNQVKELQTRLSSTLSSSRKIAGTEQHVARLEEVLGQIKGNLEHTANSQFSVDGQAVKFETKRIQTVVEMIGKFVSAP